MDSTRNFNKLCEVLDFARFLRRMGFADALKGQEEDFQSLNVHAYWNLRQNYTELPRLRQHCEALGGSAELPGIARALAFWGIRHLAREIEEQESWDDTADMLIRRFCA